LAKMFSVDANSVEVLRARLSCRFFRAADAKVHLR